VVESLRESGYTVLHAGNAAQAAAEFEQTGGKIDMLITDVVMPGGAGPSSAGSPPGLGRRPGLSGQAEANHTGHLTDRGIARRIARMTKTQAKEQELQRVILASRQARQSRRLTA
jgi:CheY-like chemotaxis protein